MNFQPDHGAAMRSNPITMLPRFPAVMLGASLLEMIQSSSDGVVVIDAARQIVLINHRAERIFGYPANLLLEKPLDLLIPACSDTDSRRRLDRLGSLRSCGRRTRMVLRGVRADGALLDLKTSVTRVGIRGDMFLCLVFQEPAALDTAPCGSTAIALGPGRQWAVSSHQASEVEKRRFSRKLYDDIGQRLSVLKLDLSWLENSLPHTNQYLPARLAEMQGLLDNVITLTKSMASTLRPPVLDDFGLVPAVEWMVESLRKRTGIRCTLESEGLVGKLDEALESAAFRIVQEGLANIEQHSGAEHAWVSLRVADQRIRIDIRDDGVGLKNPEPVKTGCYGLLAMYQRVFILGGTIRIENARPHGVLLQANIPLDPAFAGDPNPQSPWQAYDSHRHR
ncbi:MAG TPA: PAS domain-containing protein [Noviherbaspirillum sp.]|nr:PAS domain-containing protein [Noviherbaspirillum sp.]